MINNGRRLHLQHGPIDLIIEAHGKNSATAYNSAVVRFETLLEELVEELPLLRSVTNCVNNQLTGSVATRMHCAASLFAEKFTTPKFTTPMIAVAGSVADEILNTMLSSTELEKVYVNNGGDIALHLSAGQSYKAGVVSNPQNTEMPATITVQSTDGIGGIATSGRHGRSLSLGIADSVTVMAASASVADAAATLIANEVTLPENDAIVRVPAEQLDPDTDLYGQAVTVEVNTLTQHEKDLALANGLNYARKLVNRQLISGAFLTLQGASRSVYGASESLAEAHTIDTDKRALCNA